MRKKATRVRSELEREAIGVQVRREFLPKCAERLPWQLDAEVRGHISRIGERAAARGMTEQKLPEILADES